MIKDIAKKAKEASYELAALNTEFKNAALEKIAKALEANKNLIFNENKKDLANAEKMLDSGEITKAVYNRLKLDTAKFADMISGIYDVIKLEDPANKKLWAMQLDEGLDLYKVSCPLGVIGVIFESRPDVVVQIAALAIKSANAVILKGGKEADFTNTILAKIINESLKDNFPENSINLIKTREEAQEMLKMDDYIDLIIPRGSNDLVKYIQDNTKIPVLGHADGICHIYVDDDCDQEKAIDVILDSKIQYPSACNAVETLLIHEYIAGEFLPKILQALRKEGVEIRADEELKNRHPEVSLEIDKIATEEDWSTEYSDKIISIKIVKDMYEAAAHINKYGSGHTDCIITTYSGHAGEFMNLVDSAGVYQNASTRFADGFRYGLGAEVGISTNKTHARGPVGLEGLVIYKYKLYGNGQISADYSGGKKKFTHKRLD